jgi:hypothetical protein
VLDHFAGYRGNSRERNVPRIVNPSAIGTNYELVMGASAKDQTKRANIGTRLAERGGSKP